MTSERQILNLIYRYCWLVDQGNYEALGEMFDECDIYYHGQLGITKNKAAFIAGFEQSNISYAPDNTPRTVHMCIDPIIKIDEEAGTASAQHYTIVLQGIVGDFNPQIIVMDLKFDTFKRKPNGEWKFATRNMCTRCVGDLSRHQKAWGLHPAQDPYFSLQNTNYTADFLNP